MKSEPYTRSTPVAVIATCRNINGTDKAQLIRRINSNPITREQFGEYGWEVWSDDEPDTVTRFFDETIARKAFRNACCYGTNQNPNTLPV